MPSVCHNYQWIEIVASAVILTGIDMKSHLTSWFSVSVPMISENDG